MLNLRISQFCRIGLGFGMTAAAARNLLAERPGVNDPAIALVLVIVGMWMGLSMSGPFLLARTFRNRAGAAVTSEEGRPSEPIAIEKFWMVNGLYWIGLATLVIGIHSPTLGWEALWLVPIVIVGLVLLARGPITQTVDESARKLHHAVGWGLLVSWPMAWAGLIYLCHRLG